MSMRTIEFTSPHQRRHFEFFHSMNHPHFSLCANVEIGGWLDMARRRGLKITPSIVHLLARVANEIPQLRRRIREDRAVEHDVVHPTFSVATDVSDAFSFCHVDYSPDLEDFVQRATAAMDEICLLYTSDAADEEDRLCLGGRRLVNKKTSSTR